jgi:probable phosphoglycerate mutase
MGELEGKKISKGMSLATTEPAASFSKRVSKWWNETILQSVLSKTKEGETINVLIVTHGGVIITLVQGLLGSRKLKPATGVVVMKCVNASVTVVELEYGSRKGVLTRYGDVAHLAGFVDVVETNADQETGITRHVL